MLVSHQPIIRYLFHRSATRRTPQTSPRRPAPAAPGVLILPPAPAATRLPDELASRFCLLALQRRLQPQHPSGPRRCRRQLCYTSADTPLATDTPGRWTSWGLRGWGPQTLCHPAPRHGWCRGTQW